ncbi:hypothetical protein [Microbacterium testaceum]|uniref:hypothetical protein n=1 Tax=Microbacterium testaceum TaxID=2033 RepID=UPI000CCE19B9|nr:hypothetical protein [Microbacterium testaceum]PNW08626.1 hypothetical protein C1632_12470 [Microbacterium testaceum]WJS92440.1 hypothetical protein NYQ11_07825 [Microbacterium testaceum]
MPQEQAEPGARDLFSAHARCSRGNPACRGAPVVASPEQGMDPEQAGTSDTHLFSSPVLFS